MIPGRSLSGILSDSVSRYSKRLAELRQVGTGMACVSILMRRALVRREIDRHNDVPTSRNPKMTFSCPIFLSPFRNSPDDSCCQPVVPPLSWNSGIVLILAFFFVECAVTHADEREEFFEKAIRPVLVDRCLECHSGDKVSGGLRLDSRESILAGGDTGPALIPGEVERSLIAQAIRYDGELQMPPDAPLSEEQRQQLFHWIAQGAVWPSTHSPLTSAREDIAKTHWAYQPLKVIEPVVDADLMGLSPIDVFVHRRLSDAGLSWSQEADRRTLIRRLYYALTGLPPSADEVMAFADDEDPMSYEKLVDRLLDSPAYGEHWARHWLDVARYSDTKGYVYAREERFWVHAWNYRDWVVNALNSDLPYDRFLLLQIAADQVPDRDANDLAAMGFLTIGRRFLGVRREIVDDQIDVVTRGTMALTVACARCHDHKYDPIPTADYYSLYGVFDSSRESLVELPHPAEKDSAFRAEYDAKREAMEQTIRARRATSEERVRTRIADYLAAQLEPGRYPEEGFDQVLHPNDLLPSFVHRWRDYLRETAANGDPVFSAWHAFRRLSDSEFAERSAEVTERLQAMSAEDLNASVAAVFRAPPRSFADVISAYSALFQRVDADWQALRNGAEKAGEPAPERLESEADEQIRQVLYAAGKPCRVPDEPVVSTEYDFDSGVCNELWKLQVELDRTILNSSAAPRFAVIMKDREVPVSPRIFRRGNPANRGDDVSRQFLAVLSRPELTGTERTPFKTGSGRLELAQAIIDPRNPLTSRVIVNRVWGHHFGAGLVSSAGDFGVRAEPPSHPELLDWLAADLIHHGWSLKHLHRSIVLSRTFRQSSSGPESPDAMETALTIDPGNRLLWRMNARRLTFEEMRDSMLVVSGDLDRTAGGKPVELFRAPFPVRRTLYGLVDRQFLPGVLRMFDFANPDLHIPLRSETTVPQQSLFLMNHPLVLERTRKLAKQVESTADPDRQIRRLYELVLQRPVSETELLLARELLQQETEESARPSPAEEHWSYGYGAYDESAKRLKDFTALPHFTGTAWQGGPSFPDGVLGWVQLTSTGGHPGNDRQHAGVRRWTAPRAMTISIRSELIHEPEPGDGVRAFVVSSRAGLLCSAEVHKSAANLTVESIAVEAGETIDFVVDIGNVLNSDQYLWVCSIDVSDNDASGEAGDPDSAQHLTSWNSERDFPRNRTQILTPLEQLAQVLICSNEFLFID